MRCPNLKELPPPPSQKYGWPWTKASARQLDSIPDGRFWPKISIITPSLNQGSFIEETIRSVLLQGYPHLEYIVIDGGSTDNTIEIVRKYEPWIAYWVSEPDRGQSHAINKGISLASGELISYLNSDDFLMKGSLEKVALACVKNPRHCLFIGNCMYLYPGNNKENKLVGISALERLSIKNTLHQPSVFWRRLLSEKAGQFDEQLHYCMDWEMWLRFLFIGAKFKIIDQTLATFRRHGNQKTNHSISSSVALLHEEVSIFAKYHKTFPLFLRYYKRLIAPICKMIPKYQNDFWGKNAVRITRFFLCLPWCVFLGWSMLRSYIGFAEVSLSLKNKDMTAL